MPLVSGFSGLRRKRDDELPIRDLGRRRFRYGKDKKPSAENGRECRFEGRTYDTATTLVRLPPLGGEGWGGGILHRLQFINGPPNRIHDGTDILVQFLVSKADDLEATRGEPGGAPPVVLDGFWIQMLPAVELNDEFVREADKINDIRADGSLAAKLPPAQLLSAKEVP
jgi:hypothetical protein